MNQNIQKPIDFFNSTQTERDSWYQAQKVACIGRPDDKNGRCGWIKRLFAEWNIQNCKVLDLACHDGFVTRRFLDSPGCSVTGIDISVDAIKTATEQAEIQYPDNDRWSYRRQNFLSDRSWVDEGWDLIICFEFIEHIPRKTVDDLIKLIYQATDNYCAISTPRKSGRYGAGDHNSGHINLYEIDDLRDQIKECIDIDPIIHQDDDFLYAYWKKI